MSTITGLGQVDIMLSLGTFKFSISTATYQSLQRKTEYLWASQNRFGGYQDNQFTGFGEDTISLSGTVYPEWRGGLTQMDALRALGATGVAQTLVSGSGKIFGKWVIISMSETQSFFAAQGAPRKQEFSIDLRYQYEEPAKAQTLPTAKSASSSSSAIASSKTFLGRMQNEAHAAVSSIASGVQAATNAVKSGLSEVSNVIKEGEEAVAPVLSAATQAYNTGAEVMETVNNVKNSIKNVSSLSSLEGLMGTVGYEANRLTNAGVFASGVVSKVVSTGTITDGLSACQNCASTVNQLAIQGSRALKSVSNLSIKIAAGS